MLLATLGYTQPWGPGDLLKRRFESSGYGQNQFQRQADYKQVFESLIRDRCLGFGPLRCDYAKEAPKSEHVVNVNHRLPSLGTTNDYLQH